MEYLTPRLTGLCLTQSSLGWRLRGSPALRCGACAARRSRFPQAGFEPTTWNALECVNRVASVAKADPLHFGYSLRIYELLGFELVMVFPGCHKILKEYSGGCTDSNASRKCHVVGNRFYHAFRLPLIPDAGSDGWRRSPHAPDAWALLGSTMFCANGADENRPLRPSTSVG